jgi:hypothetical protein
MLLRRVAATPPTAACLPACLQELGKRFPVVCLDESHFIKDGSAQRTKATVPLVKEARRALLLTGTPALNKPKEIYQQVGLGWVARPGGALCRCGVLLLRCRPALIKPKDIFQQVGRGGSGCGCGAVWAPALLCCGQGGKTDTSAGAAPQRTHAPNDGGF